MQRTPEASWGNGPGGALYGVYCPPGTGLAVLVGANDGTVSVNPTVLRIRQFLVEGPRGGVGAPK